MYTTLKLIHVLAVIVWFGGGVMLTLAAGRAHRADAGSLAVVSRIGAGMGAVFGATSGVAFLTGIGMMLVPSSPWEWSEIWINIGIIGFFASAVLGARFISPSYDRLADAAGAGDASAISSARSKLIPVTMADLTILTVVVASMVYKWG